MLETNRFSVEDSTFACAAEPLSRHSIVDKFATIAWFNALATELDAESVGDFVRKYSPHCRESPEAYKSLHRQWSERSIGRRRPGPATIMEAEARCPGTARFFDLPLWPALRTEWPLARCVVEARGKLPIPHVKQLNKRIEGVPAAWRRAGDYKLFGTGTLDDLACLLLLLRRANEAGVTRSAYRLARMVFRSLLIQAGWLMGCGLLRPLVEFIDRSFFVLPNALVMPCLRAASYFDELEFLVSLMPKYVPEVQEGFDPDTWARGARMVLCDFDLP